MNREVHVRFREHLRGKIPWVTRPPVSQLAPGSGKTRKAYLWAYRSNDLQPGPRMIVFDYQSGRSGAYARDFLGAWRGHLMVDDYSGVRREVANIIVMPFYQGNMTNRSVGCSLVCPAWAKTCYLKGDNRK